MKDDTHMYTTYYVIFFLCFQLFLGDVLFIFTILLILRFLHTSSVNILARNRKRYFLIRMVRLKNIDLDCVSLVIDTRSDTIWWNSKKRWVQFSYGNLVLEHTRNIFYTKIAKDCELQHQTINEPRIIVTLLVSIKNVEFALGLFHIFTFTLLIFWLRCLQLHTYCSAIHGMLMWSGATLTFSFGRLCCTIIECDEKQDKTTTENWNKKKCINNALISKI